MCYADAGSGDRTLSPGKFEWISSGSAWCIKAELSERADSENTKGDSPCRICINIGLDVHNQMTSYCVKDGSGKIHGEGMIPATRLDLDRWRKTLPRPWTAAMEGTTFTGWIYDPLKPHAAALKVAHPLMLRSIAASKQKNDRIDATKICDWLRCDFLPECRSQKYGRRNLKCCCVALPSENPWLALQPESEKDKHLTKRNAVLNLLAISSEQKSRL